MKTALTLAIAGSLLIGGCVSLFPKADPARLYKLDPEVRAEAAGAIGESEMVVIQKGPTTFTRTSTGDGIITAQGSEIATIAGARWSGPAQVLFDEALVEAFDAAPRLRLLNRSGQPARMVLRVEVRTFEARYLAGIEAAPTVVVEARANLAALTNEATSADRIFRAEAPASENRVGPIVDAYNAATGDLLGQIVSWTEQQATTSRSANP